MLILTTFNICAALDESSVTTVLSAFAHAFKRVAEVWSRGVDPEFGWTGRSRFQRFERASGWLQCVCTKPQLRAKRANLALSRVSQPTSPPL